MAASSFETLFNEASFEVFLPATLSGSHVENLAGSERDFVFFGEPIALYLIATLPKCNSIATVNEFNREFLSKFDIQVESALVDQAALASSSGTVSAAAAGGSSQATGGSSLVVNNAPVSRSARTPSPNPAGGGAILQARTSFTLSSSDSQRGLSTPLPVDPAAYVDPPSVDALLVSTAFPAPNSKFAADPAKWEHPTVLLRDDAGICVYPLKSIVGFAKGYRTCGLTLSVVAVQRPANATSASKMLTSEEELCEPDFDTINLLKGIVDDNTFSVFRRRVVTQSLPFKRAFKRFIPARDPLRVRMHPASISHDRVLISMEIENVSAESAALGFPALLGDAENLAAGGIPVRISNLQLTVAANDSTEARNTKTQADIDECFKIQSIEASFPVLLKPQEEACFIFSVSLVSENIPYEFFADGERYCALLGVTWSPASSVAASLSNSSSMSLASMSVDRRTISEVVLPSDADMTPVSIVTSYVKPFNVSKLFQERREDDLAVSYTVNGDVSIRKTFTLQVFVVNRSPEAKDLAIIVPNEDKERKRELLKRSATLKGRSKTEKTLPTCFSMSPSEFLDLHEDNEKKEASIVCLESNVHLGILQPNTCKSVSLHFVAIKEGLHTIPWLQLFDRDMETVVDMRNVLAVYVKPEEENDVSSVVR